MVNFPDWHELAVCRTVDPELWWPLPGGDNTIAKAICDSCDAVEQCLAYALKNEENGGIWGGKSALERRHMRRDTRAREGGVHCRICDTLFEGSAQHQYCSKDCHLEARRRRAAKAS